MRATLVALLTLVAAPPLAACRGAGAAQASDTVASATSEPRKPSTDASAPPLEPGARPVESPSAGEPGDSKQAAATGAPEAARATSLPDGIVPGVPVSVAVPGDRSAHVVHAVPGNRRAIVYLHGLCGNIRAVDGWSREVSRWGTLVALQGDRGCPGSQRRKWSNDVGLIDIRVDRALRAVAEVRGGQLDLKPVAVFGYSQGATRAEALVKRFPEKYPWAIAAGTPIEPKVERLGRAQRIAIVAGEKEPRAHMRRGADALKQAGKTVRFFVLPGASHGEYGPDGSRVMDEVFRFVFANE